MAIPDKHQCGFGWPLSVPPSVGLDGEYLSKKGKGGVELCF